MFNNSKNIVWTKVKGKGYQSTPSPAKCMGVRVDSEPNVHGGVGGGGIAALY